MIRRWILTGLALCSVGMPAMAGESRVYKFDGWTMTITPGPVRSAPLTQPAPVPADLAVKTPVITPSTNRSRFDVQPVSLKQTESATAAPMPAVEASPLKPLPDPLPNRSTVVPPSPQPAEGHDLTTPYFGEPIITPRPADTEPLPAKAVPAQTAMYRDVYNSIPFSRAEYHANPSYRHDATMEFLFNQMRPTVIQRGTTNVNHYDYGYGYGYGWGGYNGIYTPYYPYTYGLRIHTSR